MVNIIIIILNCVQQQELAPTNSDMVNRVESSATASISSDISAPREVKDSNASQGDERCKVTKEVKSTDCDVVSTKKIISDVSQRNCKFTITYKQ